MVLPISENQPLRAALFALGGAAVFSVNDVAIKLLSGGYALHQVILIRSMISLCVIMAVIVVSRGGFAQLLTRRVGPHAVRVSCILMANVTYFLGLAVLPLADAVAVAFVAPLILTALSGIMLGEPVGWRRWAAVAVGMLGVVVMLRPGLGVFQPASLLVAGSAVFYAMGHVMTRRMRDTESSVTLNFWVQVGFVVISLAMGLTVGDGHLAGGGMLAFLFRPWVWPPSQDWPVLLATGLSVGIGGLLMAQAYRSGAAAMVAPFEYAGMPMAILWGLLFFGTVPDTVSAVGIALICGAGLYTIRREWALRRRNGN